MKRLRRVIFSLLAPVSAMLCIVTVVLWVRSYRIADYVSCGHHRVTLAPTTWFDAHWELLLSSSGDGWLWARLDGGRAELQGRPKPTRLPDGLWCNCGHEEPSTDMGNYLPGQWWHGFDLWWESHQPTDFGSQNYRIIREWAGWIGAPAWFVAPLLAVLPVLWLKRLRTAMRRTKVGHCDVCGYDLRATPSRCPECGAPVASKGCG